MRLPRHPRALRVFLITLAVISGLASMAVGAVYAGYSVYKGQLPDAVTVAGMEPPQDSYVYDSAGELIHIYEADAGHRHVHVQLSAVSRWVKVATVDVEDRHFYEEGSWDIPRLAAAGINNLTHSGRQGGSTITEQLAKDSLQRGNLLGPTSSGSLDYKIKEIVLGNEIAANFTKDQILEMYLNRVFYANHATGIESAAELYFGKPARDLDLAEAAMLSGLPQSPTLYNPLNHDPAVAINPLSKARQRVVLEAMVNNGDISQRQADAASAEKLNFASVDQINAQNIAPSFIDFLTTWLQNNFGDTYTNPGGWSIHTTLNLNQQRLAQATVHDQVQFYRDRENMRDGALVAIDPKTGEVQAMVGAWDNSDPEIGQVNMADLGIDPGSTVKLFTYTAAIASGKFTMTTPILDAPYSFPLPNAKPYSPVDYDRRWHGTCELKLCLGNSFNMPAVKVEVGTGIPYIDSVEIAAGVSAIANPDNKPDAYRYAATLGDGITYGISLLDLADGAATIADLGVHHDPIPVTRITEAGSGQATFTYNPQAAGRRVIPDNVAFIMNEITSNDANRQPEFGLRGPLTLANRRVSAKTGTADFFKDNLTVGWTPDLLSAVWVGSPHPSCIKTSDRPLMQHKLDHGLVLDQGAAKDAFAPFTPAELAQAGLQPDPRWAHSCGHLAGVVSGVSGAAPIWHDFMSGALGKSPQHWYKIPKDVVASASGDDADFFLPGARNPGGGCYYWQPTPDPSNPCQYTGTVPPPWYVPPSPSPGATPNPSGQGTAPPSPPLPQTVPTTG